MKKFIFKRILSASAAVACLGAAISIVPLNDDGSITADAADTLTAFEITEEMRIGWNLGNTLDATGGGTYTGVNTEIAWGQPRATKELISAVKARGFNTIRIPTTWYEHLDSENNIDPAWLARVHEVVDYAYSQDMYVILNLHHEEWVNRADLGTAYDEMKPRLLKIWQQLADEFSDYDQHLIFECMNEPRAKGTTHEWWGPQQNEVDCINNLNADFVNLIRSDDSPYADTRLLMIPGYCASSDSTIISKIVVPDDDYVAVSIHAYSPYNFTMNADVADHSTFTDAYANELIGIFNGIRTTFIDKDIPVVIGEFSASNYNNTEARCEWAELYLTKTKEMGIPCVLWDNDARNNTDMAERHDWINRNTLEWYEDSNQVIETMMSVLADDSIPWAGNAKSPTYDHADINSGETLYNNASGQALNSSNVSSNYDITLDELKGKEVAVKFTGDAPSIAFMDSNWDGWTEIKPYAIDWENGIAYYSYDDISNACSSMTPAHFCFKSYGSSTITQVSIIDAATISSGNTNPTDPTQPSDPSTDPSTEPTTEADDDFTFELLTYEVELTEDGREHQILMANFEGTPGASIGGCLGYGTNADDWVNIEWQATIGSDGTADIEIPIADIPYDFSTAQLQVWWSNLWDNTTETATDKPCEMVNYEILGTGALPAVVYGDADGNGVVELNDAVLVLCNVVDAENYPLTSEQIEAADVYQNGDGISNMDALAIQKYLAQLIPALPES